MAPAFAGVECFAIDPTEIGGVTRLSVPQW